MIPSLPTELLHQIFDSICQPLLHFSSYKERQSTLRSLCLTSRLFRSIAQPLLVGDLLWIESEASLNRALDRIEALGAGSTIKCLIVADGIRVGGFRTYTLKRAMPVCPSLASFSLEIDGIERIKGGYTHRRIDTALWASMSRKITSLPFLTGSGRTDFSVFRSHLTSTLRWRFQFR